MTVLFDKLLILIQSRLLSPLQPVDRIKSLSWKFSLASSGHFSIPVPKSIALKVV
jgi:hypothetical protein